jgi:hypothetical protein
MEIIGRGSINMNREFYSHDWRQPYFEDDIFPHYKLPIPTESALTIGVVINIYPEARDTFKVQSYELMTNFATSNFSGKLQMGFTYSHVDDDTINFTFRVPIFPTHFEPVVVVKLHYIDTKAGLKFTSYFKCNMAKLERD